MSLSERIAERPPTKHGMPCSVAVLLNTLEGAELEALISMLGTEDHPGWTAGDIYDALAAEGYKVGYQSINRHRGRTREELRLAMVTWIETKYHRKRRQRRLGKLTPIEFETIYMAADAA